MTRFARAKGSKASNERVCEEATSWEEMKKQLIEKKKEIVDEEERKKIEHVRNTNYQNFLRDRNAEEVNKTQWAEFPKTSLEVESIEPSSDMLPKKKTKNKRKESNENEIDSGIEVMNPSSKRHKKDINNHEISEPELDAPLEISSKVETPMPEIKKNKRKKKKLTIVVEENGQKEVENKPSKKTKKKSSYNSNNKKRKTIDIESLTEQEKKKFQKKQVKRLKQLEKKKLKKQLKSEESKKAVESSGNDTCNDVEGQSESFVGEKSSINQGDKKKNKISLNTLKRQKLKSGDFKRKKSFQPNKIMINGKEVTLSYFDGFPIKKEDAINLSKLRKQMISKGLPRSEIDRTIKLERRKAEKALAREKKNVCFNCRKFGHNLADCPETSKGIKGELFDVSGTGICFKCGSSEHTSFACKVVQGSNYKFATCFICKEQGHISRQCPDNARGLYPKGGCCNMCGDVTHLKRDCPEFRIIQEKEQEKFQVQTINSGNPDDMDKDVNFVKKNTIKPNKIIKF